MDLPETTNAWIDLSLVHGSIRVELSRRLEAEAGIGLPESELLLRLASVPGERMRMCDLARQLSMAQSGVTRLVDRVVAQGWVSREQRPDDRRTTDAVLTKLGAIAVERARPIHRSVTGDRFARLSAEERTQLRSLLRTMLTDAGACATECG